MLYLHLGAMVRVALGVLVKISYLVSVGSFSLAPRSVYLPQQAASVNRPASSSSDFFRQAKRLATTRPSNTSFSSLLGWKGLYF
jgi:hypothetical protein